MIIHHKILKVLIIGIIVTISNQQLIAEEINPQQVTQLAALVSPSKVARTQPKYDRIENVIYGRRDGMALTMDVFTPTANKNGRGVIVFVSAEYKSGPDLLALFHPIITTPFLDRGYVVFAVLHSSQPKYTVPEIVEDAQRSVRFVKHHAKKYGIDPNRIGTSGGSSGGHLALMMGCLQGEGNRNTRDLVERESSKVASVACFFPPTDFLKLEEGIDRKLNIKDGVLAPFDFREIDPKDGKYKSVSPTRRNDIARSISPREMINEVCSPTRIMHGDEDKLVPLSQSESFIEKLKDCGVECELIVKKGKGHCWFGLEKDLHILIDWFDLKLK
jgi:acetyl esterase/lipase